MTEKKLPFDIEIKIGKRININDINEMHHAVGWGNYTPEQWKKVKKQSTFMVSVLHNKKTIGFARCIDDSELCTIFDVVVHPKYQRQGIGTLIMKEVLKYVNAHNFGPVDLTWDTKNKGLDKFYEKLGFVKITNAMRLKGHDHGR